MNVVLMLIGLTSLGLAATPVGAAQPTSASPDCRSEGDLSFVCGPKKPEDLAVLPGTDWLIASGMEEGGGLHLIDTRTKMWRRWIAARPVKSDPRFPDCDSPPDPERFSAHGLALRAAAKGTARLFVVGHGGREFFPFVFTLFMFILFANFLGLIPYSYTVTSQIVQCSAMADA